ncbi:MAG: ABC transporter permease [Clostridia bacterium]|nr:ABC transporter permease [Clostridia bacterium]
MKLIEKFKEIYRYRHMLYTLVKQDIRGRYKGSVLGFLWTLLNPLFMLLVYSVVFSIVFRNDIENYPIYLFICLMPWNCFQNSIFMGSSCVSNNASILKKVYFPREILPIATVISNLFNYLCSAVIIFIALLVSGVGISWTALFLPVIILIQAIFNLGLIFFLSYVNVYFRYVLYMMNPIMMIWMYATPILYSVTMVPEKYQSIYMWNPMTRLMVAYQDILYNQKLPDLSSLGITVLIALGALVLGYLVFAKLQRRFAEEV